MSNRSWNLRGGLTGIGLGLLLAAPVAGQQEPTTHVDAFVDAYYAFDFNQPRDRTRSYATQPYRHNEFNVNLAFVRGQYAGDRVHGNVALATGTYMESNYAAEPAILQHILEAWAGVKLGPKAWLDLGVFPSHIGFESAISSANWTLSRSLMAEYSPYYESGARLTFPFSDKFTATALVVNGWQNIQETNDSKSFGVQLQLKPNDKVLLNYSNYIGDEAPATADQRGNGTLLRVFHDAYAQFTVSPKFSLAAVGDVGTQQRDGASDATWWAASGLAHVTLTPQWLVGLRVERYDDPDQVIVSTGVDDGFVTTAGSVNLDYQPTPNVMWRTELRVFGSDAAVWPGRNSLKKGDGFLMSSIALTLP